MDAEDFSKLALHRPLSSMFVHLLMSELCSTAIWPESGASLANGLDDLANRSLDSFDELTRPDVLRAAMRASALFGKGDGWQLQPQCDLAGHDGVEQFTRMLYGRFGEDLSAPYDSSDQRSPDSLGLYEPELARPGPRRSLVQHSSKWSLSWDSSISQELEAEYFGQFEQFSTPAGAVLEVADCADWVALIAANPMHLGAVPAHYGVRGSRRKRLLIPHWGRIAQSYSGVHITWTAFLLSEGALLDIGDIGFGLMRFQRSERTFWLT